jgi:hypothetical protein
VYVSVSLLLHKQQKKQNVFALTCTQLYNTLLALIPQLVPLGDARVNRSPTETGVRCLELNTVRLQ